MEVQQQQQQAAAVAALVEHSGLKVVSSWLSLLQVQVQVQVQVLPQGARASSPWECGSLVH